MKSIILSLITCLSFCSAFTLALQQNELGDVAGSDCERQGYYVESEVIACDQCGDPFHKAVRIMSNEQYKSFDNVDGGFVADNAGTTPNKIVTFVTADGESARFLVKQSHPIQVINTVIATFLYKALLGDELIPDIAVVDANSLYPNECGQDSQDTNRGVRKYYIASKLFTDMIMHFGNNSGQDEGSPCFCTCVYGNGWGIGYHVLNIKEHDVYQGTERAAIVSMILQDTDAFENCRNHGYRKFGSIYKLVRFDLDHSDLFFAPFAKNPIKIPYNSLIRVKEFLTEVGLAYIAKISQEKDKVFHALSKKIDESFEILSALYTDEEIRLIYKQCASRFIAPGARDGTPHYNGYGVGQGPTVNSLNELKEIILSNVKTILENVR